MNAPLHLARDPATFEAFYRAHVGEVGRFIARRVDNPQDAADLTADVFCAVIERASTYDPARGSQQAWVFGIARNIVAEHSRRRARVLKTTSRIIGRSLLDNDSTADIAARIDAERDAREALRAMARLPDADRRLLEAVSIDGLSIADVAAHVGLTPATVRVRLHRARQRLSRLLGKTPHHLHLTQEA